MFKRCSSVVIIALIILPLLASCNGDNPVANRVRPCGSPTPISSTPPPADKTSARLSNADLLKRGFASTQALRQYHFEFSGHISGKPINMSGDVDVANQRHWVYISEGQQTQTFYVITIHNQSWISDDNLRYDGTTDQPGFDLLNYVGEIAGSFDSAYLNHIRAALDGGKSNLEMLDYVQVRHIVEDASKLPVSGSESVGTEEFWVTQDAHPAVIQLNVIYPGKRIGSISDLNIHWSNLNQCIDIQPPA